MNPNFPRKPYRNVLLLLILVVAAILRFYHLSYQSFGLDELHTMNEADPGIRWKEMLEYLRNGDQHPPLFFIIERMLFTLFGSSEWVARGFAALCGLLGVWAMYGLGKELLNKRLGLLAAAFTCINYFCIFYS
jgi:mannosyltransferase